VWPLRDADGDRDPVHVVRIEEEIGVAAPRGIEALHEQQPFVFVLWMRDESRFGSEVEPLR
jgi:hypothetical protein